MASLLSIQEQGSLSLKQASRQCPTACHHLIGHDGCWLDRPGSWHRHDGKTRAATITFLKTCNNACGHFSILDSSSPIASVSKRPLTRKGAK